MNPRKSRKRSRRKSLISKQAFTPGQIALCFLVFIIVIFGKALAVILAFGLGIWGVSHILKISASTDQSPEKLHGDYPEKQNTYRDLRAQTAILELKSELKAICKKLDRPAKWKTQLGKIQEAAILGTEIDRVAYNATGKDQRTLQLLSKQLQVTIAGAANEIAPIINAHFSERTEKLQSVANLVRVKKTGQELLVQLNEIGSTCPVLMPLIRTLSTPLEEMVQAAKVSYGHSTRLKEAKALERSGERNAALSVYLDVLYELKTDDIDDDEQGEQIGDIEDKVRNLILGYAVKHLKRRKYNGDKI